MVDIFIIFGTLLIFMIGSLIYVKIEDKKEKSKSKSIANINDNLPNEVILRDQTEISQNRLMRLLDEEDKQTVLKIMNAMIKSKSL